MSIEYTFKDFVHDVATYIELEYNDTDFDAITDDERMTVKNILDAHYHFNDSTSNAANYVISYLKESRAWTKENTK